jgi:hypothetical protein
MGLMGGCWAPSEALCLRIPVWSAKLTSPDYGRVARDPGGARSILLSLLLSLVSQKKSGTSLESDAQNGREPPRFGFSGCCDC